MSEAKCPVVLDARVVTGTGGGPDKTILNSPRLLEPLGYRMLCAYLRPPGDPDFEVLRKRAAHFHAPLVEIDDRGPFDWRVITQLLRLCRREKVAIYHGHDYKSNLLGLLLARLHPMRLITTAHGWVHHTARTPLYYCIDKFCLRRYERVLCVSEDLAAACREAGVHPRRLMLLENGIDLAGYARTTSIAEAKGRLGFDPARPLIGAIGRLVLEKGFDVLIDAIAMIRRGGMAAQLVIVGDGDEGLRLQAMIERLGLEPDVRLAGFRADPRPYFEALDVFALSSRREGLPNVLLEAMAVSVPCVATRVGGVPRVIEDGVNGRLVAPGEAGALAAGITQLLGHEPLKQRLGAAGRRVIEERYSFARRIERLAALYDELLEGVACRQSATSPCASTAAATSPAPSPASPDSPSGNGRPGSAAIRHG
jgi:glycosyltransferase involved in cell wall biosynthesis